MQSNTAFMLNISAIIGLSNMLGLISTDMVFDAELPVSASVYYCTLCLTLFKFPYVLRMSGVALMAVSIATRALLLRLVHDMVSAAILVFGGLWCFHHTLSLATQVCSVPDTDTNIRTEPLQYLEMIQGVESRTHAISSRFESMLQFHCVMFVVVFVPFCLQVHRFWLDIHARSTASEKHV